jgi:hypothetical protein
MRIDWFARFSKLREFEYTTKLRSNPTARDILYRRATLWPNLRRLVVDIRGSKRYIVWTRATDVYKIYTRREDGTLNHIIDTVDHSVLWAALV